MNKRKFKKSVGKKISEILNESKLSLTQEDKKYYINILKSSKKDKVYFIPYRSFNSMFVFYHVGNDSTKFIIHKNIVI